MGFGLERTVSYTEIRWTWSLQGKEQAGLLDSEEYPGFLGILPSFVWSKQRFDVLCESAYFNIMHHLRIKFVTWCPSVARCHGSFANQP